MAVDDLWFGNKKGPDGKRLPTVRHGRGKRYRVRYTDPSGQPRARLFDKKVDAEKFDATTRADIARGTYVDHSAGRQSFRQYAETWRNAQPHRANTASNTKSRLEHHVYPAFGERPLAAIRNSELQAFVTGLPLAASSVRPVWGTVSAIFAAALRDRLIGHDPTVGVKLPEIVREKVVPLTRDQVDALIEAVPNRYRALILMDAGTGLRQGEVFGVCLRDGDGPIVDFLRKNLRVVRQIQARPTGGGPVVCRLKNRSSYRVVPLGDVVLTTLSEHVKNYPPVEVEMDDETDPAKPTRRKFLLLFTDDNGKALDRNSFNGPVWRRACKTAAEALRERAAAERDKDRSAELRRQADMMTKVTQHDLRHFYASALIRAGLNPKVVAERLGHADAAMTLRVYAHLWPDDEDRSRQAIDDALGVVPASQDHPRSGPDVVRDLGRSGS